MPRTPRRIARVRDRNGEEREVELVDPREVPADVPSFPELTAAQRRAVVAQRTIQGARQGVQDSAAVAMGRDRDPAVRREIDQQREVERRQLQLEDDEFIQGARDDEAGLRALPPPGGEVITQAIEQERALREDTDRRNFLDPEDGTVTSQRTLSPTTGQPVDRLDVTRTPGEPPTAEVRGGQAEDVTVERSFDRATEAALGQLPPGARRVARAVGEIVRDQAELTGTQITNPADAARAFGENAEQRVERLQAVRTAAAELPPEERAALETALGPVGGFVAGMVSGAVDAGQALLGTGEPSAAAGAVAGTAAPSAGAGGGFDVPGNLTFSQRGGGQQMRARMSRVPGIGDEQQALLDAMQDQRVPVEARADLQVDTGTQLGETFEGAGGALDEVGRDFDTRRREANRAVEDARTRLESMRKAVETAELDPNRFWAERGTAATIFSAIGLFAGVLSETFGGENQALTQINAAIQRDLNVQQDALERQERGVERQQGILELATRQVDNIDDARRMAEISALRRVQQDISAITARSEGSVAAQNSEGVSLAIGTQIRAKELEFAKEHAAAVQAQNRSRARAARRAPGGNLGNVNTAALSRQAGGNALPQFTRQIGAVNRLVARLGGQIPGVTTASQARRAFGLPGRAIDELIVGDAGQELRQEVALARAIQVFALSGKNTNPAEITRLAQAFEGQLSTASQVRTGIRQLNRNARSVWDNVRAGATDEQWAAFTQRRGGQDPRSELSVEGTVDFQEGGQ